ncbi:hypothetical protein K438DRAFT_1770699 [Mycena galopus ATCC 62051]|nr:hypothetical protein K438DRAFT_1770699 [Mycena galopus ATCC 62051]
MQRWLPTSRVESHAHHLCQSCSAIQELPVLLYHLPVRWEVKVWHSDVTGLASSPMPAKPSPLRPKPSPLRPKPSQGPEQAQGLGFRIPKPKAVKPGPGGGPIILAVAPNFDESCANYMNKRWSHYIMG